MALMDRKILLSLLIIALGGCEGSGVSTSIGFGGGPGIGIGSRGYGAYGGYGGGGVGLTFPSSSAGLASMPDQQVIDVTIQHALEFKPLGEAASWSNPETGHVGTVTPTRGYQNADGQTCREFQQTVGQGAPLSSTACRDASGVWQVGAS